MIWFDEIPIAAFTTLQEYGNNFVQIFYLQIYKYSEGKHDYIEELIPS